MPKIHLRPNSPEYADSKKKHKGQLICDYPGCCEMAEYRAPKHRDLEGEYYWFCLEHVREYNSSWDYFNGMTPEQVQEQMLRSLYGDRPTWRHEGTESAEDVLKRKAWQSYHFTEEAPRDHEADARRRRTAFAYHHDSPEYQAMATLGLEPPLDLEVLKTTYKKLAKKYHPDYNPGCKKSEELLKEVNIAYTTLREAFEKYQDLNLGE